MIDNAPLRSTAHLEHERRPLVAAVVPAYKVSRQILGVIEDLKSQCDLIYVVDDCCPEASGKLVEANHPEESVRVLFHKYNQGVGGAVMTGYKQAIADGVRVIVKVDGDGQMDSSMIPRFVSPILNGRADYTKGNRFFDLSAISRMPKIRIFGNAALSFLAKLSTGYWNIFDPTNGFTAIHADVAVRLPLNKISRRYFFETDMLFRLSTFRAVVKDVPMDAKYEDEVSNLKIRKVFLEFVGKHMRNFFKRIFYTYFLRDVSIATLELIIGLALLTFGFVFGISHWVNSAAHHVPTPVGTIVLSATALISGLQLALAFLGYDIGSVPKDPIHAPEDEPLRTDRPDVVPTHERASTRFPQTP